VVVFGPNVITSDLTYDLHTCQPQKCFTFIQLIGKGLKDKGLRILTAPQNKLYRKRTYAGGKEKKTDAKLIQG
jgi:hypothetical protein